MKQERVLKISDYLEQIEDLFFQFLQVIMPSGQAVALSTPTVVANRGDGCLAPPMELSSSMEAASTCEVSNGPPTSIAQFLSRYVCPYVQYIYLQKLLGGIHSLPLSKTFS